MNYQPLNQLYTTITDCIQCRMIDNGNYMEFIIPVKKSRRGYAGTDCLMATNSIWRLKSADDVTHFLDVLIKAQHPFEGHNFITHLSQVNLWPIYYHFYFYFSSLSVSTRQFIHFVMISVYLFNICTSMYSIVNRKPLKKQKSLK